MKRILFIAPHCYPIKSSESICNSKVAQTLANGGYKVDVYTCSDDSTYPSDKQIDSLLKDSKNLSITTISKGVVLSRKYNIFKLLKLLLYHLWIFLKTGYFYNGIDTPFQILKAVKKRIKKEGKMPYDVMITRGFGTDYVGIYMSKKYALRWIANWNDPFPLKRFPAPYGKGCNAKCPLGEQKVIDDIQKYADMHTFPSERLKNYMFKCFPNINRKNAYVIHHMAHNDLMCKKKKSKNEILTLVHCGSVNSPRNPKLFLEAMSEIIRKRGNVLKCIFIGGYDDSIKGYIDQYNLNNNVCFEQPMTYSESLNYMSNADLSLIIEAVCEEGIYLPTKFVDAMQSKTPVFCVSPKLGTLNDIVMECHVGYSCDNSKVNEIEKSLDEAIDDFKNDRIPVISDKNIIPFTTNYILNQYISLIN